MWEYLQSQKRVSSYAAVERVPVTTTKVLHPRGTYLLTQYMDTVKDMPHFRLGDLA